MNIKNKNKNESHTDKNNITKAVLWPSTFQKNLLLFRVKVIKNNIYSTGI